VDVGGPGVVEVAEEERPDRVRASGKDVPNLAALLKYMALSQVMFGTDYPYVKVTDNVADLTGAGLTSAELKTIDADNALRLLPRLKG
jgi:predicted TIM-barrel fold metal-dependent hydrolase